MPMTTTDATDLVRASVLRIVPDADLDALGPDADLRDALELDSLDVLSLVELLCKGAGVRIDEEDYPRITSVRSCADLVVERS